MWIVGLALVNAGEALPEVPQLTCVAGAACKEQQAGGAVVPEVVRTDAPVVIEPQGELEIVTGWVGWDATPTVRRMCCS